MKQMVEKEEIVYIIISICYMRYCIWAKIILILYNPYWNVYYIVTSYDTFDRIWVGYKFKEDGWIAVYLKNFTFTDYMEDNN